MTFFATSRPGVGLFDPSFCIYDGLRDILAGDPLPAIALQDLDACNPRVSRRSPGENLTQRAVVWQVSLSNS